LAKNVKALKPVLYRHSTHVDWGVGMIIEETASKLYLVFETGGPRSILNVQRYRDLLVPAELDAAAAEDLVAKLKKSSAKPAAKTAEKKGRKKAVARKVEEEPAEAEGPEDGDKEEEDED
jgi:hypothetical protein